MKMNIKATGIELTPAVLGYAHKRLSKIGKYLEGDPVMAVELGKSTEHHKKGEIFRAEVRIAGSGADFYAEKETSDIYRAIDEVKDEVIHEITRVKGKKLSLMRRGARKFKDMVRGFAALRDRVKFRRKI
jgi:ribosomal subunit interface protein